MSVCSVGIGEIVDHPCLNFLFNVSNYLFFSSPKPTFNHQHMNGRRYTRQNPSPVQEVYPQHEEIVNWETSENRSKF
jgi:hypothetical protein